MALGMLQLYNFISDLSVIKKVWNGGAGGYPGAIVTNLDAYSVLEMFAEWSLLMLAFFYIVVGWSLLQHRHIRTPISQFLFPGQLALTLWTRGQTWIPILMVASCMGLVRALLGTPEDINWGMFVFSGVLCVAGLIKLYKHWLPRSI